MAAASISLKYKYGTIVSHDGSSHAALSFICSLPGNPLITAEMSQSVSQLYSGWFCGLSSQIIAQGFALRAAPTLGLIPTVTVWEFLIIFTWGPAFLFCLRPSKLCSWSYYT